MTNTIDGFAPSGDAWHRDLLLQASASDIDRPEMISAATAAGMGELLKFRHAVRDNYASAPRHDGMFENLRILQRMAPLLLSDVERFIEEFSATAPAPAETG